MTTSSPALVGPREIARLLGVRPATVEQWRYRRVLPAPEWIVSSHPVWRRTTIEAWARDTGRR